MIFQKGVESKATLLEFEQIGPTESVSHRTLRLKLQVNRENDRNFVTEVEQKLNLIDLQDLKIGSKVRVRYHPRKPKQVLLISETDQRP